jgi:hypothetical protein
MQIKPTKEWLEANQTESQIQRQILDYFETCGMLCHAIPNSKYKQRQPAGVLDGAADLLVWFGRHAVYIEVKKPGGVQSKDQKDFQADCVARGIPYFLVDNLDDAMQINVDGGE